MGNEKNKAVLTVEELQAKVEELNKALSAEADSKKQLQDTLNDVSAGQRELAEKAAKLLQDNNDLTAIAQDQEKQLEALKAENEMLKAVNDELTNELEGISKKDLKAVVEASQTKAAPVLSTESFTVAGKSYGFNYPVMVYKGKRITNDDVLASTELQEELVAAGHSMIKAK